MVEAEAKRTGGKKVEAKSNLNLNLRSVLAEGKAKRKGKQKVEAKEKFLSKEGKRDSPCLIDRLINLQCRFW